MWTLHSGKDRLTGPARQPSLTRSEGDKNGGAWGTQEVLGGARLEPGPQRRQRFTQQPGREGLGGDHPQRCPPGLWSRPLHPAARSPPEARAREPLTQQGQRPGPSRSQRVGRSSRGQAEAAQHKARAAASRGNWALTSCGPRREGAPHPPLRPGEARLCPPRPLLPQARVGSGFKALDATPSSPVAQSCPQVSSADARPAAFSAPAPGSPGPG